MSALLQLPPDLEVILQRFFVPPAEGFSFSWGDHQ